MNSSYEKQTSFFELNILVKHVFHCKNLTQILRVYMLFSSWCSLFLLIKLSAVQYKLSISLRWDTCTLSFFYIFSGGKKACEDLSNVHMFTCEFLFF